MLLCNTFTRGAVARLAPAALVALLLAGCTIDVRDPGSGASRDTTPTAGPAGAPGADGEAGPAGPPGAAGTPCWDLNGNGVNDLEEDRNRDGVFNADDCGGQIGLFGDASSGDLTLDGGADWSTAGAAPLVLNFRNFIVPAGATLRVPSGTVVRCTGDVVIDGALVAMNGALGGDVDFNAENADLFQFPAIRTPDAGVARGPAGFGEIDDAGRDARPGTGGAGLAELQARGLRAPLLGGGGGGGDRAGDGGAALTLVARGAITVNGTISANGGPALGAGGGGGAGGVLILAAGQAVTLAGAIAARGGAGGAVGTITIGDGANAVPVLAVAGGGGGGGGIVHLIAPSITVQPTAAVDITGGPGGLGLRTVAAITRMGGGGGGGAGGSGGNGGAVLADNTAGTGAPGANGLFLQSVVSDLLAYW